MSDAGGLCAGAVLPPQRTTILFLLGWQSSVVSWALEPDLLSWIVAGSDGEQRFCERPRKILVTFRCLTGALSCVESSSRGCNCLQAPARPHVHSSSQDWQGLRTALLPLLGHTSFSSCTSAVCRFTDNLLQVRPLTTEFEKFMSSYSTEITNRAPEGLWFIWSCIQQINTFRLLQ